MQRLWDFYDGEPFMQNPHLGLLTMGANPRKKGRKKMAKPRKRRKTRRVMSALQRKYFGKGHGRKAAPRRRKKYRKNWISPATVVAANPRRRQRSRVASPRRKSRKHYRRNPAFLGLAIPSIKTVAFTGVGLVGPSFVQGFLTSMFPSIMQQAGSLGIAGKYVTKGVSLFGLHWLVRRFVGSNEANAVLIGGAVNLALTAVNDFAPGIIPANPIAGYVPIRPNMRGYVGTRPGLRAVNENPLMRRGTIPSPASNSEWANKMGSFPTQARYFRY